MKIKKPKRANCFKVYIRQCKRCGEYCEVPTPLSRFCATCLEIVKKEKIINSLKARGCYKENVEPNTSNDELVATAISK
jgi:hypothetical protein